MSTEKPHTKESKPIHILVEKDKKGALVVEGRSELLLRLAEVMAGAVDFPEKTPLEIDELPGKSTLTLKAGEKKSKPASVCQVELVIDERKCYIASALLPPEGDKLRRPLKGLPKCTVATADQGDMPFTVNLSSHENLGRLRLCFSSKGEGVVLGPVDASNVQAAIGRAYALDDGKEFSIMLPGGAQLACPNPFKKVEGDAPQSETYEVSTLYLRMDGRSMVLTGVESRVDGAFSAISQIAERRAAERAREAKEKGRNQPGERSIEVIPEHPITLTVVADDDGLLALSTEAANAMTRGMHDEGRRAFMKASMKGRRFGVNASSTSLLLPPEFERKDRAIVQRDASAEPSGEADEQLMAATRMLLLRVKRPPGARIAFSDPALHILELHDKQGEIKLPRKATSGASTAATAVAIGTPESKREGLYVSIEIDAGTEGELETLLRELQKQEEGAIAAKPLVEQRRHAASERWQKTFLGNVAALRNVYKDAHVVLPQRPKTEDAQYGVDEPNPESEEQSVSGKGNSVFLSTATEALLTGKIRTPHREVPTASITLSLFGFLQCVARKEKIGELQPSRRTRQAAQRVCAIITEASERGGGEKAGVVEKMLSPQELLKRLTKPDTPRLQQEAAFQKAVDALPSLLSSAPSYQHHAEEWGPYHHMLQQIGSAVYSSEQFQEAQKADQEKIKSRVQPVIEKARQRAGEPPSESTGGKQLLW
ncbi:MAG: hypothetical protein H8E44_36585 [Planctomycetes bacterium]|nr:hypothetical protein [Planctomycetota bacterium]